MRESYSSLANFDYRELENFLHTHPAVLEAAVVPGPVPGCEVVAYIVPRPGVFDPDRLKSFFFKKIKSLGLGGFIEYRENLPRSGTGKLYRRVLVEEAGLKWAENGWML